MGEEGNGRGMGGQESVSNTTILSIHNTEPSTPSSAPSLPLLKPARPPALLPSLYLNQHALHRSSPPSTEASTSPSALPLPLLKPARPPALFPSLY